MWAPTGAGGPQGGSSRGAAVGQVAWCGWAQQQCARVWTRAGHFRGTSALLSACHEAPCLAALLLVVLALSALFHT